MEFGLFVEFPSREGTTQAQIFKDSMELIQAAEDSGSEGVWLAEYHFDPGRSVLSAPVTVAGAVAARTKKVKIGLAVHVLPLRNPVQIAEEIATLDHLSDGRLDFGIGRSAFPRIYQGYGFDYSESRDRFDECLEIILKSWTEERFSFKGKYYQYDDLCVVPKPLQKPHPPHQDRRHLRGHLRDGWAHGISHLHQPLPSCHPSGPEAVGSRFPPGA